MKNNNKGDGAPEVMAVLLIIAILWAIFFHVGKEAGTKEHQIEAIKHGCGQWVVNAEGDTTFAWKEVKP